MSVFSDLKRAMRPAELDDDEWRGLRIACERTLAQVPAGRQVMIDVPSVTAAGRAYLLTLFATGGRLQRFTVDHAPDLSSPQFEAYVDKRAEWAREKAGGRDGQ